jgi:hypothetical protein
VTGSPNPRDYNFISPSAYYLAYHHQLEVLAESGGNYFRMINSPWSTDIEFEQLNNYSDRMEHAWEMDEILRVAEELGLRMHFDLQIQYSFEAPDPFSFHRWDWSITGDPLDPGPDCIEAGDPGNCYRTALNLEDPKLFFTNADAKKYYKYKLRYIIARWGYSNEIALIELFSEINNAGSEHPKEKLQTGVDVFGNPTYGCFIIESLNYNPYKEPETDFIISVNNWQEEMCQYIKQKLQHSNHPLAVNYAGPPDWNNGDDIYQSEFVDIMTYNFYQAAIEKNEFAVTQVAEWQVDKDINKPFMFSEYGPGGGGYELCDHGVDFIKALTLSPFSGTAGAAMNWDWQFPGQEQYWHYMGPVKALMEGIPLDEENWQVGIPLITEAKEVEVMYLIGPELEEGGHKVVGVISNRTFNYFTQGTGVPCLSNTPDEEYQFPVTYSYSGLSTALKIPGMGSLKDYAINWYDALTGIYWQTTTETSGLSGELDLNYPGVLTGDGGGPILFFEIFPEGDVFKSQLQNSTGNQEIYFVNLDLDSLDKIQLTPWNEIYNFEDVTDVRVLPNPTDGLVRIQFDVLENVEYYLLDHSGQIIERLIVTTGTYTLDLSGYSAGIYFITDHFYNISEAIKIIKQ